MNSPACHSEEYVFTVIREELRRRVGEGKSITLEQLAGLCGVTRRKVEVVIECRMAEFPFAVVSGDGGYYRPAGPADLNHYDASLRSRIRCIALRIRALRRAATSEGYVREAGRFIASTRQGDLFG